MPDGSSPRKDIGLSLLLIVLCSAVLWESRDLPPGSFEPLGSAPVPQAVALLIIGLALIVLARALRARAGDARGDVASGAEPDDFAPRPLDAAASFALTVIYVLAMAFKVTSFAIATTAFLFVTIGFLVRFERRLLPVALLVGLVMGFGCQYFFTQVFVVDLPAS